MGILHELLELRGKEVPVFKIDDLIDEIQDCHFREVKFTKESRVFESMYGFIEVKYNFNKEDCIKMIDKVIITDIEAMY